jgi:catechol 2,3-dioxygenase-like lactoylglutathione lyase family enzyme
VKVGFTKSKRTFASNRTRRWCRLLSDWRLEGTIERYCENTFCSRVRQRPDRCLSVHVRTNCKRPIDRPDGGIAHVALRVNDLQKSRDFYNTLGFEEAFSFTDAGKVSVSYVKVSDRQFIELIPRTSESQPGGILHTCFEVADIESLHNAYVAAGLQPTEAKKARAGNLLFVMHGPDNQLLEYTQYLPDSLHTQDHGKHLSRRRISSHLLATTTAPKDLAGEPRTTPSNWHSRAWVTMGTRCTSPGSRVTRWNSRLTRPRCQASRDVRGKQYSADGARSKPSWTHCTKEPPSRRFPHRSRRHRHSICYSSWRLD